MSPEVFDMWFYGILAAIAVLAWFIWHKQSRDGITCTIFVIAALYGFFTLQIDFLDPWIIEHWGGTELPMQVARVLAGIIHFGLWAAIWLSTFGLALIYGVKCGLFIDRD